MVNKANELDEESALVGDEPFGFPDNDERIQDEDNIHLIIHGPNRFILRFPSMHASYAIRSAQGATTNLCIWSVESSAEFLLVGSRLGIKEAKLKGQLNGGMS
ncbi:hypothetical protein F441_21427 [Phytophthora nicotianae CJ01A1]|uniref:Uncharacterized protein n=1 Tax=Phytophthora nicotianae CJ01A1 TaxID=1317063 RepID=W2VUC4_PHYNI|nr:hypothetical protein F441_21427 [Phytophthora nicotianae CJ01A1]